MCNNREEFLSLITAADGRISTNAVRESFFIKRDKSELWQWFLECTKTYGDWTIHQRAAVVRDGTYETRPMCRTCGEHPIQFLNRKVSEYCSKGCASKDNKNLGVSWSDKEAGVAKRKATNLEKYGVEFHTQTDEWRKATSERMSVIQVSEESRIKLYDKAWLFAEYVTKQRDVYSIAEELQVYYGTVFDRIDEYEIPRQFQVSSIGQRQIGEFIRDELGIPMQLDVIGKLHGRHHIDVYVESHKFGIEFNGLFYHSVGSSEQAADRRKYHQDKTIAAEQRGITLIHITDEQWKRRKDIVKSMIRGKLGKTERIMARKTRVVEVQSSEAIEFFTNTHIQGFVGGSTYLALEFDGQYVAMMSFGKSRFTEKYDAELLRFSNLLNTTVVGGFSKLLSHYRKMNPSHSILSYADRSRSNGLVYVRNGFVLVDETQPGYGYTDGERLYNRQHFQKHKLPELLKVFDESLTEEQNMFNNKYRKYYDCGQLVFVLPAKSA